MSMSNVTKHRSWVRHRGSNWKKRCLRGVSYIWNVDGLPQSPWTTYILIRKALLNRRPLLCSWASDKLKIES